LDFSSNFGKIVRDLMNNMRDEILKSVLILLIFNSFVFSISKEELLTKTKSYYQNIYDVIYEVRTIFVNQTDTGTPAITLVSNEKVYFKKPNLYKLEIRGKNNEVKKVEYFDGNETWVYEVMDKRCVKRLKNLFKAGKFLGIESLVKNLIADKIEILGEEDGGERLYKVDIKLSTNIKQIIWVNDIGIVKKYYEKNKQGEIEIIFRNIEINVGLDDSLFKFIKPVDVKEMQEMQPDKVEN
jgi:outer membrane lipoprotein-sorting protein